MRQKSALIHTMIAVLLSVYLSSCSVINGIFKAGAVTGIVSVVVIIAIIIFIIARLGRRN